MQIRKLNKLSIFNGSTLSILIGLSTFTLSIIILIANVDTGGFNNKLNIYLSDKTEFSKKIDGKNNNLVIGNEEIYRDYLPSQHDLIFMIDLDSDLILKKFNPEINKYEYHFNSENVSLNGKKYYFKKSKHLFDKIFYSENESSLKQYIKSKDSVVLASLIKSLRSKDENTSSKRAVFNSLKSSEKLFFNNNPRILIWIILISIAIAFSFSIIPFLLSEIVWFNRIFDSKKTIIKSLIFSVLVIALSLLPLLMLALNEYDFLIKPLDTTKLFSVGIQKWGLHWNSIAPYTGVLFWLILIFLMLANTEKIFVEVKKNASVTKENEHASKLSLLLDIETKFERQFVILAIFLAFTIFCTDMLLSSLNQIIQLNPKEKIFPNEFSFINGLMQTFFLSIIYFYVSGGIKKIKSEFSTLNLDSSNSGSKPKEKKFVDYLKLILTVLAPVLGGGLQVLFEIILG